MIALDTSALVTIVKREPEHEAFTDLIAVSETLVGAPVLLEMRLVLDRIIPGVAQDFLDDLLARPQVQVASFTQTTYRIAAAAFERFGKGRGHPAGLNFGDCLSYAIAREFDAPLLFKGQDFIHTDIARAYP